MNYSIIIPVYNEENFLPTLLKELNHLSNDNQIVLIDDGSTDNSHKILKCFDQYTILKNEVRMGKGFSIIKALDFAKGKYVIFFDGDLEIDTKDLKSAISYHNSHGNIIIKGNRFNSLNRNTKSIYDYGNFIFNKIFNIIYKTDFHDIFCCLIVIEKKLIKSFDLKSRNFGIETEIMSNVAKKKLPCKELQINYYRRADGKKLSIMHSFEILMIMIKKRLV